MASLAFLLEPATQKLRGSPSMAVSSSDSRFPLALPRAEIGMEIQI